MDYEKFMGRALQLAKFGEGLVSPNPMVGAVIVTPDSKIIGEGWHRKFGESHAEVNACNSVSEEDKKHLFESTIFITLEPCSHFGKTPPCVDLLIRKNFKRVVIGCVDPFEKVAGRGIKKLKDAGIEVIVGILEEECKLLNKTFFFAHENKRPYVTLKWAQSEDGWMDSKIGHPYKFSTTLSQTLVHKLRSENDAILTSTKNVIDDNPILDARLWNPYRNPRPIIIGKSKIQANQRLLNNDKTIIYCQHNIDQVLSSLYNDYNVTSVLVESGPTLLHEFLKNNLWEECRVEIAPVNLDNNGIYKAPYIKGLPYKIENIDSNRILFYNRSF